MLAVKPHLMTTALNDIKNHLTSQHLIISVAAGFTIESMIKIIGTDKKIARVMPNTPAFIGLGASAIAMGQNTSQQDSNLVTKFADAVGVSV